MKHRKSKRILSSLLALAMCVTLFPAGAFAEEETTIPEGTVASVTTEAGTTYYETLSAAVAAVVDSENKTGTVELLKDASGSGIGLFKSKGHTGVDLTIDFNGHTYTCTGETVGSTGTESQVFHLERDNKVTLIDGKLTESADTAYMIIQNYCDLTLDRMTVDGTDMPSGSYSMSNNCGDTLIKDSTIIADEGNVAFDVCDYSSYPGVTVTVEGNSNIQGKVEVTNPNGGENNAKLVVKGGTFSNNTVSIDSQKTAPLANYVPENYEIVQDGDSYKVQKMENKLVVEPSTDESGKVSASLEGAYTGAGTTIEDGESESDSAVSNSGVTVDLTTPEASDSTTSATLTVTAETAQSLAQHNAPSLSVKTDVGTVVLDQTAVAKMENVSNPVVVSVAKTSPDPSGDNIAAEYTVSVTSGETNLLPDGADNGTITITLPVDQANLQPWYVTDGGIYAEKLPVIANNADSITFTIGHLSTIQLLTADPENTAIASITKADGTKTYYSDVNALQTAVSSAIAGDVIDLLDDVTATSAVNSGTITAVFHVNDGVTINGNGHTLAYSGTGVINHIININGDADNTTINDLKIDATGAKYGVQFYCTDGGSLNGVTIDNGSYAAVNVNGATGVKITDCTFAPSGYANIDYSMGSGVTTIPSVDIDNVSMKSDIYQVWADKSTVDRIKDVMDETGDGSSITNDAVMEKITSSITYESDNGGSLKITVGFGDDPADIVTGEVESTTQPSQGGGIIAVPSYSVSIDAADNGSVSADRTSAMKGKTVTLTVTPDEGYVLDSLTVTDKNGDAVELTKVSDSEYAFTMPASKVSVAATFVKSGDEPAPTLPFVDVDPDAWYYDAVEYAYNAGLMTGTAADKFSPSLTTTRGMIVSILYRQEGEPAVTSDAGFADVVSGAYYEDAVNWAAEEGIVNGYSDTAFGPNDAITREQMAAILMNYAEYKGQDVTARADLSGYTDADTVSAWATDAVQWANAEGLINGMSDTQLAPKGSATRAQVAAILQRFLAE